MFGDEPATKIQILDRLYGKSETPFSAKANQPVAEPPKPSVAEPAAPRPENKAAAEGLFPEPTVKTRPLTKAEQNEFADLTLKIKANREAGGPQLTSEETQRYEHLTAIAGQMDLLSSKQDVSSLQRRYDSLKAKAEELDRQRANTQNRAFESKSWERREVLFKEAKIYDEEAKKAHAAADAVNEEILRTKAGKPLPPKTGSGDMFGMGGGGGGGE